MVRAALGAGRPAHRIALLLHSAVASGSSLPRHQSAEDSSASSDPEGRMLQFELAQPPPPPPLPPGVGEARYWADWHTAVLLLTFVIVGGIMLIWTFIMSRHRKELVKQKEAIKAFKRANSAHTNQLRVMQQQVGMQAHAGAPYRV
jgi:hypothetical protein